MKKLILLCSIGLLGTFAFANEQKVPKAEIRVSCAQMGDVIIEAMENAGYSSYETAEAYDTWMNHCNQ